MPDTAPKHTPGPWKAARNNSYGSYPRRGKVTISSGDQDIAWIRCGRKESAANAHLIAAAPALLSALEAVQWSGRVVYDPNPTTEGYHTTCPRCGWTRHDGHAPDCQIGTALALARGEQPDTRGEGE